MCSARGLKGRLGAAKRRILSLAESAAVGARLPLASPFVVAEGMVEESRKRCYAESIVVRKSNFEGVCAVEAKDSVSVRRGRTVRKR